jgi:hypothetical protein
MAQEVETTMFPKAATLHIALEVPSSYRVLYMVCEPSGRGSATPSRLHGSEQLRAFLQDCEISATDIHAIMTRVAAGRRDVLDLGHLDTATVLSLLLFYAGT